LPLADALRALVLGQQAVEFSLATNLPNIHFVGAEAP
jgi:hypothetical protein